MQSAQRMVAGLSRRLEHCVLLAFRQPAYRPVPVMVAWRSRTAADDSSYRSFLKVSAADVHSCILFFDIRFLSILPS